MNDLSTVTLAPAPTAMPSPSMTASRILAVAEALQPDLVQGFQIDALRLRLEMERAFGGSDADGAWDWKLAYEAGEVALVLFLRKFGGALLARTLRRPMLLPQNAMPCERSFRLAHSARMTWPRPSDLP